MKRAISMLNKSYQITVPKIVRKKLNLRVGDILAFEIENSTIKLRKATPVDVEFISVLPQTLNEWNSQNDNDAYRDL